MTNFLNLIYRLPLCALSVNQQWKQMEITMETPEHCFFACPLSRRFWYMIEFLINQNLLASRTLFVHDVLFWSTLHWKELFVDKFDLFTGEIFSPL